MEKVIHAQPPAAADCAMKGSISAAAALSPPTRPSHTQPQPQPCSDAAETIAYSADYKLEIGAAGFFKDNMMGHYI